MTLDPRIQDLIQRWHELRQRGRMLSAEELCRDCPELISEVQRHLPGGEPGLPLPPGPDEALAPVSPTIEFRPAAAGPEPRFSLDDQAAPREQELSISSDSYQALAPQPAPPQPQPPDAEDEEYADDHPAGPLGRASAGAGLVLAVLRFGLDSLRALPARVVGAFLALLLTVVVLLLCAYFRLFSR
jgi:hypothetical protein